MKSLGGNLLVASPRLPDSNFSKTVVLILQHDENGALGVVLNRPSDTTVRDVWEQIADTPCAAEQPLYLGGPLIGPVIAVHTDEELSQQQVAGGLYFSMQRESLEDLVARSDSSLKMFSGYSGWGEGQLEKELESGAWLVVPATSAYVFATDQNLWKTVVDNISHEAIFSVLGIKHFPSDPTLN